MPEVDFDTWKQFISAHLEAYILQTAEWGELKKSFGWDVVRLIVDELGVQILFRKLPLGFTVGYLPKPIGDGGRLLDGGPLTVDRISPSTVHRLRSELDSVCRKKRAVFLKVEPDSWGEK